MYSGSVRLCLLLSCWFCNEPNLLSRRPTESCRGGVLSGNRPEGLFHGSQKREIHPFRLGNVSCKGVKDNFINGNLATRTGLLIYQCNAKCPKPAGINGRGRIQIWETCLLCIHLITSYSSSLLILFLSYALSFVGKECSHFLCFCLYPPHTAYFS
jgi:hypothetical protein